MIASHVYYWTPKNTGLTREAILALARTFGGDSVPPSDRHWPEITEEWTDEFIYPYGHGNRQIVKIRTSLRWIEEGI